MTPSSFLWTRASDPQAGLPGSNQHSGGTWEVFKKWGLLYFVWGTLCSELQAAESCLFSPWWIPGTCSKARHTLDPPTLVLSEGLMNDEGLHCLPIC